MKMQSALLAAIVRQLQQLPQANRPLPYRRRLSEYSRFEWKSIGAEIVDRDDSGPAEVERFGHRYVRRSGSGKYGDAIWYSRALSEQDSYEVLIKFADYAAEPLQIKPPKPPMARGQAQPKAQIEPMDVQRTDDARDEGKTRPAHWHAQPEAQPPDSSNSALLDQAQQVGDAPSFWKLASEFIRGRKDGHEAVSRIANDAGSSWNEKALTLVGANEFPTPPRRSLT